MRARSGAEAYVSEGRDLRSAKKSNRGRGPGTFGSECGTHPYMIVASKNNAASLLFLQPADEKVADSCRLMWNSNCCVDTRFALKRLWAIRSLFHVRMNFAFQISADSLNHMHFLTPLMRGTKFGI